MEQEKQKILLCGDVEGKFHALFTRVEKINKKAGPFSMLLCVGNFFGVNNKEFEPYKTGQKKVPVPTYILGPNNPDQIPLFPSEDHQEICPNVFALGTRGLYKSTDGLKIAYISGLSGSDSDRDPTKFSTNQLTQLHDIHVSSNPAYRGCDILLTSQWPNNIMNNTTHKAEKTIHAGSDYVSWLGMKLKPRYHISGLEGIYYERPPFRCPNLGEHDTTMEIVTRFIGLARVGNPEKQKWLYALSLCPLDKMKVADLLQKTTDETPCPYNCFELERQIFGTKRTKTMQYFYDSNYDENAEASNKKKKTKKTKIEFDQSKCWFCLASPSVEKQLIISVGNHSYLAMAKGGLVEEHFLICPIEHYQNTVALPEEVAEEINRFKNQLRKFYASFGKLAVFFERNYKTSHMQLQSVPIPKEAMRELKEIFIEEAEDQGFKLEELDVSNRLEQVIPAGVPYFTVELPDETFLYTKIQGAVNFPLNFGREVLAAGPILNMTDRVDWKECVLLKEDEEALRSRLCRDYEKYDFTT